MDVDSVINNRTGITEFHKQSVFSILLPTSVPKEIEGNDNEMSHSVTFPQEKPDDGTRVSKSTR